ncbi:MAG: hypothetical protein KQH53_08535 [Desulfarculaceae bacterium]|nr:hypothetical protein [Desulfarculaceae bacterium]
MPKRKSKKKRSPQPEYEEHYLTVDRWEGSYSYGLNPVDWLPGPYSECRQMKLIGKITTEGYRYSPEYELTLFCSPRSDMREERRGESEAKPIAVGRVESRKGYDTIITLYLPGNALNFLAPLVTAGRIVEVYLHTTRMKWR